MVGPDYNRPEVSTPAAFRFTQPSDVAQTADTEWWKAFGRPGARRPDRGRPGAQQEREDRRRERRAGAGVTHAHALPALSAGQLPADATRRASRHGLPAPRSRGSEPADHLPGCWPGQAGRSTCGARSAGRPRRRAPTCWPPTPRAAAWCSRWSRRCASTYLQLLGLDEQLVIAKRTLASYEESVHLFELQKKYGQISKMTVEQARSQYESAAVEIPLIEVQIAQTEQALSILLGRNPGPIPRGKLDHARGAGHPRRRALRAARAASRSRAGRAAAHRRQCADRRRESAVFPDHLADRCGRQSSPDLSTSSPGRRARGTTPARSSDRSSPSARSAVRSRSPTAAQKAALRRYQLSIQNAFADVDNALVANLKFNEQLAAQERLVAALRDYARLARLQYAGGYTPYSTVLQAEQSLFPAEPVSPRYAHRSSPRPPTPTRRWAAAG